MSVITKLVIMIIMRVIIKLVTVNKDSNESYI